MATGFLSPIGMGQWLTDQGVVLSGGKINTYLAGTTTPAATYTTSALSVANPNPIILDSAGRAPQEIWLQQGSQYKFVVTDANGNSISNGTFDNLSGINDTSNQNAASEWVISGSTPTYVSATQFTVPGNQVTTFSVNRRMYASVSAGTVYGTITASAFGTVTTVTVAWDSGSLDSGLTQVAYALLNASKPSITAALNPQVITATGTLTPSNGAVKARIRMVGGGGAGGGTPATSGTNNAAGGGGSSGGYIEFWITSGWQALTGTALTIGAGGVGAVAANGGNGTSTTFGALATAPGGNGGILGAAFNSSTVTGIVFSAAPGSPSAAPTSTQTIIDSSIGGLGGIGLVSGTQGGLNSSGNGGSNPLGTGGAGSINVGNVTGSNGNGYGSGGAGAFSGGTATTYAGGNGAPGVIIVEEYL